ncbi:hypothetical protein MH928_17410 [Flavobacterium sp. WW92]|uniref:hypothetical protein n=1 Tax=unclassified Flavobacterium TaxID=196869 RepID=UPI0022249F03|nr:MULTISPECIES: hypothetical protein [unclassified Flavobacterium]WDO13087.1 hypothetical protein MH928_17410 [Flavobacterium sp. WW92]
MISETFKRIIISTLGSQYSPAIASHLEEQGIRNNDGKPFSNESIRQFVNGNRENREVERAVVDLVEKESQEAKQLAKRTERVIKSIQSA